MPYFKNVQYSYNVYGQPSYFVNNLNGNIATIPWARIMLSNGTLLSFYGEGPASAWLFIDINGYSAPNRAGKDIFVMNYYNNGTFIPVMLGQGQTLYSIQKSGINISDENKETNRSGMGCSFDNKNGYYAGYYCGALIIKNNWHIPDDYPW